MNSKISDRDLINLSELTYQNIENLKDKGVLSKVLFDGNHVKQNLQNQFPDLKKDFIEHLSTFPEYYISTFQKYRLLDVRNHNDGAIASGYYGAAFYNATDKTVVIANRGTEPSPLIKGVKDFWADSGFLSGKMKQQFLQGFEFYKYVLNHVYSKVDGIDCENIFLTGHSLGGGIAALQFAYFYGKDPLLKEMRTFEAPGIGLIVNDCRNNMALSGKNTPEYAISERITDNGYGNISFTKDLMIEYGTNLDWVYNDLPHIGTTLNPLSIGGRYEQSNPLTLGFTTDVVHPVHTYKIYKLDNNDNIVCGHINLEHFFKLALPILISLKLNYAEVQKYFEIMYDKGFNAPGAINSALVDRFTNASFPFHELGMISGSDYDRRQKEFSDAMNDNRGAVGLLYSYGVLFGFLKSSIPDKTFLLNSLNKTITTDFKGSLQTAEAVDYYEDIRKMPMMKAEWDPAFKQLERKHMIMYLEDDFSITSLDQTRFFVEDKEDIRSFLILFKLQSNNDYLSFNEQFMYDCYFDEYMDYAKKNTDFISRKFKMECLVEDIIDKTTIRQFDYY